MEPYRPPPDAMHVDVRFWPKADIDELGGRHLTVSAGVKSAVNLGFGQIE